jgi:hypothetical protein
MTKRGAWAMVRKEEVSSNDKERVWVMMRKEKASGNDTLFSVIIQLDWIIYRHAEF